MVNKLRLPHGNGTRLIAPRLTSGERRDRLYNALPPDTKREIVRLARRQRVSVSYMLEAIVIQSLMLPQPDYKESHASHFRRGRR